MFRSAYAGSNDSYMFKLLSYQTIFQSGYIILHLSQPCMKADPVFIFLPVFGVVTVFGLLCFCFCFFFCHSDRCVIISHCV